MPLQNRINPTGSIERSSARGSLMGNRGVLHNTRKEVTRSFKSKAWITCLLEFKGRQRELMAPNAYTELFFLDEVTAFAAGHRPCAECRRARYNEFRDAWSAANQEPKDIVIRAPQIDEILQEQRMRGNAKVTFQQERSQLPHGTIFQVGETCYAVCNNRLLEWSFDGYAPANEQKLPEIVDVLTPRSVVSIFSAGFRPEFHSSAGA